MGSSGAVAPRPRKRRFSSSSDGLPISRSFMSRWIRRRKLWAQPVDCRGIRRAEVAQPVRAAKPPGDPLIRRRVKLFGEPPQYFTQHRRAEKHMSPRPARGRPMRARFPDRSCRRMAGRQVPGVRSTESAPLSGRRLFVLAPASQLAAQYYFRQLACKPILDQYRPGVKLSSPLPNVRKQPGNGRAKRCRTIH